MPGAACTRERGRGCHICNRFDIQELLETKRRGLTSLRMGVPCRRGSGLAGWPVGGSWGPWVNQRGRDRVASPSGSGLRERFLARGREPVLVFEKAFLTFLGVSPHARAPQRAGSPSLSPSGAFLLLIVGTLRQ